MGTESVDSGFYAWLYATFHICMQFKASILYNAIQSALTSSTCVLVFSLSSSVSLTAWIHIKSIYLQYTLIQLNAMSSKMWFLYALKRANICRKAVVVERSCGIRIAEMLRTSLFRWLQSSSFHSFSLALVLDLWFIHEHNIGWCECSVFKILTISLSITKQGDVCNRKMGTIIWFREKYIILIFIENSCWTLHSTLPKWHAILQSSNKWLPLDFQIKLGNSMGKTLITHISYLIFMSKLIARNSQPSKIVLVEMDT